MLRRKLFIRVGLTPVSTWTVALVRFVVQHVYFSYSASTYMGYQVGFRSNFEPTMQKSFSGANYRSFSQILFTGAHVTGAI